MATLRRDTLRIHAAEVGPDNPLPPLRSGSDVHSAAEIRGVDAEMDEGIRYGRLASVLPYLLQDGYGRDRRETELPTLVLENDFLRATFLPGYGGRLWSLIDTRSQREMLHRNPMFQPANLALRNAWFAGGVEWNIGATGHTPLTCEPLHAARVAGPDGAPILRLYEWERIREVVYSLDFWLPDRSPVLLVSVRIVNPHDHDVPMYWWSNIAVPESDGVRVLAPADSAFRFGYDRKVHIVPVPMCDGDDVTYPARRPLASDIFFDTAGSPRPWVAALDARGTGLVQASTGLLRGRKLFVWGRKDSGRRWQEFLSGPGAAYCEIQAGLARTQLERLRMPAQARWSWVEAYGRLDVDPAVVHGDWTYARATIEHELDGLLPDLDAVHQASATWAEDAPQQILHRGSGWGALEQRRRQATGAAPLRLPGTPFDAETLGPEQHPWVELLDSGTVPAGEPCSYVGPTWQPLLDAAPDTPQAWLHRGVLAWQAGRAEEARTAWSHAPGSWLALRNLAVATEDPAVAADLFLTAHGRRPDLLPLSVETLRALLRAGRAVEVLRLIDRELPNCDDGRVRMAEIEAALAEGDLDRVDAVFSTDFVVADIREGERSLSDLWFAYQEARAALASGRPLSEAARERVRAEHPVPRQYAFHVS